MKNLKSKLKTEISILFILGTLSPVAFNLKAVRAEENHLSQPEEAIIILSTNTLNEMHLARKIIEDKGGRIKCIFPPRVIIGNIPQEAITKLSDDGVIQDVRSGTINLADFTPLCYPQTLNNTVGTGRAFGALKRDTSLYLAGDIAVSVFFPSNWSLDKINKSFAGICTELNQFITEEPNAHIIFTFIKEVDSLGNIRNKPSDPYAYAHDLRNTYNTHWSCMVYVFDSWRDQANKPVVFTSGDESGATNLLHEVAHLFGALDQYPAWAYPNELAGYLGVVNANAATYGSNGGYFFGRGEGAFDLMRTSTGPITTYTRGQIGWRFRRRRHT